MKPIFIITVLLVLFAAGRIIRINEFRMDTDETWTIWQTFGTPQQIIAWTPPTETPFYYLALGFWKGLTGIDPFTIRYLSVLGSLIGSVAIYRAVRRIYDVRAALLAMVAYAALALHIVLSLYARSYFIALSALPLGLWLTERYFAQPCFRRALPLGLCLLALYAATITVVPAFAILGLYTLVAYPRAVWRWIMPGLLAAPLALIDIAATKLQYTQFRVSVSFPPVASSILDASYEFLEYFTGIAWVQLVWLILILMGILFMLRRSRPVRLHELLWLGCLVFTPVILYYLEPQLGFYRLKRYAWWYMLPLAVWIGVGLAHLSTRMRLATVILLLSMMFANFRLNDYSYIVTPLGDNLRQLANHLNAGDVVLLDPGNQCSAADEWDYYTKLYFPRGLTYVKTPDGYRRVWYVSSIGHQKQQLEQHMNLRRIAGQFIGPPSCLFRLYEAAPDSVGIRFDNGMRFHGSDIVYDGRVQTGPAARREGEAFKIRLWWSVDGAVDLDYSVGVFLQRAEQRILQNDGPPNVIYPDHAPRETSRWIPGRYYVEERELHIPYPIAEGDLSLRMAVYWFKDQKRVRSPGQNDEGLLPLRDIYLKAW